MARTSVKVYLFCLPRSVIFCKIIIVSFSEIMNNIGSPYVRKQSKKIVLSVCNYLKELLISKPNTTIKEIFSGTQKVTADAYGMSLRTVAQICAEARKTSDINSEEAGPMFQSPKKNAPQVKSVAGLDHFNKDIVHRTV